MSLFRRRTIAGSRVAVTGASAGIGLALAEEFGRRGAKLVLNARREDVLRGIAEKLAAGGTEVEIVVGDVADPEVRAKLLAAAQERFGGLDTLINNAGVGVFGRFADAQPEQLRQVFEVDFFAAAELTRSAIPLLRQGRDALVINIGSILGQRGIPYSAEYCAAKFAMRGFSEALRPELKKLGIGLLLVSPGTTDTGFFNNVLAMNVSLPWRKNNPRGTPPAAVARATANAAERGRREIVPSFGGAAMLLLNRFFPWPIDWYLDRA